MKKIRFFDIPTQTINLSEILSYHKPSDDKQIERFQLSDFVRFKEYKEYLNVLQRDSSEWYYQSQLPDSAIGSIEVRAEYLNNSKYNDLPVVGISWESAMNFCRWKTIKDNKESLEFIYRLPTYTEWAAAYHYLSEKKIPNDLNKNYSDWLMNSKYDASEVFTNGILDDLDYIYLHKKEDSKALIRKFVLGNSFLFQHNLLIDHYDHSYYADKGYRQVAFRFVKVPIKQPNKGLSKYKNLEEKIVEYWGILPE